MIQFDKYPYAQIGEAFRTVLGRLALVLLASLAGSMLGGLTATRSPWGLWMGAVGSPAFSVQSIFVGVGIFVLPVVLFYAIASIRGGWPLRLTWLCSLLMWWNIHKTIRWSLYDSPVAKQEAQFEARLKESQDSSLQKTGARE